MVPKPLKFPHCPSDQYPVQMAQGWVEGRFVKAPIVIDPAPNFWTEHP